MESSFSGMLAQLGGAILGFVLLPFVLSMIVDGVWIGFSRSRWAPLLVAVVMSVAVAAGALLFTNWGVQQQETSELGIPAMDLSASVSILLPYACGLAAIALVIRLVGYRRRASA